MEFNEGLPPEMKGHFWLRVTNTDEHPVPGNHSQGVYGWKCGCHQEIQGLSDRVRKNMKLDFVAITGWVALPDPAA